MIVESKALCEAGLGARRHETLFRAVIILKWNSLVFKTVHNSVTEVVDVNAYKKLRR